MVSLIPCLADLVEALTPREKVDAHNFAYWKGEKKEYFPEKECRVGADFEKGRLIKLYFELEINQPTTIPSDEIEKLAEDFMGEEDLRIIIRPAKEEKNSFIVDQYLGDIYFFRGNWANNDYFANPRNHYKNRAVLEKVLDCLNMPYAVHEQEGKEGELYVYNKLPLLITKETIKEAYEHIVSSGYIPTISSSRKAASFSVWQSVNWYTTKKDIKMKLSISKGNNPIYGQGIPVTSDDITIMDKTLRRHGFDFEKPFNLKFTEIAYPQSNFPFREWRNTILFQPPCVTIH